MIRAKDGAPGLAENVRRELRKTFPRAPEPRVVPLGEAVRDYISPQRFTTSVLGIFAFLGLTLSAAGVYGVMRQWVASRVSEIGVRMAVGAQRGDIFRLVVGQGMVVAIVGAVAGLGGAFGATRLLESMLYGVTATDALVFTSVPLILAIVALAACALPASRAVAVDPITALRYE